MKNAMAQAAKWSAGLVLAAFLVGGWVFFSRGGAVTSDKTVIRVWDWWNPAANDNLARFFEKVEADFEAANPDIDLRYQYIPFGTQYVQKLMSSFAAGNPPDAFQCSIIWATDLYDRGVIRDLNDLMAGSPEVSAETFFPISMKYISRDGRVFGVPTSMDSNALIVNAGMLKEAGLDASPHAIDSWEKFVDYAQALTIRDERGTVKRAGFLMSATGDRFSAILPWLAAEGKNFLTDDLKSTSAATVEGITAMQFMYDLMHVYHVSLPPGAERQDFNLFMEGKAAMIPGGTWQGYEIYQTAPDMDFAMTTHPPGPHGKGRASVTWVNMMMMPKNAAHPEETWRYLEYYGGRKVAIDMLEILNRNSPRIDFYDTPEWAAAVKERPFLAMVPEICAAGAAFPYKRFEEINDTFRPYFQRALLGDSPIDEAMRDGNAAVERVLEGNWADEILHRQAESEAAP